MGSGQHENKVRAPPDFFHSGHLEPALRDLRSEELEVGRTSSFSSALFVSDPIPAGCSSLQTEFSFETAACKVSLVI